jgi:hypothetical protein
VRGDKHAEPAPADGRQVRREARGRELAEECVEARLLEVCCAVNTGPAFGKRDASSPSMDCGWFWTLEMVAVIIMNRGSRVRVASCLELSSFNSPVTSSSLFFSVPASSPAIYRVWHYASYQSDRERAF